jgi:hypothetical protein
MFWLVVILFILFNRRWYRPYGCYPYGYYPYHYPYGAYTPYDPYWRMRGYGYRHYGYWGGCY